MTEPVWAKRNILLNQFNLTECSVVDFGCGDKSVLKYQTFREYLGLDIAPTADIQINFDTEPVKLDNHYDVALVLGVLEYLKDPAEFVNSIKNYADRFIIMVLERDTVKVGWKNAFTYKSLNELVTPIWNNCQLTRTGKYVIAHCSGVKS